MLLEQYLPNLNSTILQTLLASNPLVRSFHVKDELDSTQQQARRLLADSSAFSQHGTLIIADHQTHGKGRHDRHWLATPGTSILSTLIIAKARLPSTPALPPLPLLSAAVPVAICTGIQTQLLTARIKYPNDIVAGGRKLGGILLESHNDAILVGFGINCTQTLDQLPPDTRMPSSSLFLETGTHISREKILSSILHKLNEILQPHQFQSSIEQMNCLCETLGHQVSIDIGDQVIQGIAQKIDNHGRLVVDTQHGTQLIYSSQVIRTWPTDPNEDNSWKS